MDRTLKGPTERLLGWLWRNQISTFTRTEAAQALKSKTGMVRSTNDVDLSLVLLTGRGILSPAGTLKMRRPVAVRTANRYIVNVEAIRAWAIEG